MGACNFVPRSSPPQPRALLALTRHQAAPGSKPWDRRALFALPTVSIPPTRRALCRARARLTYASSSAIPWMRFARSRNRKAGARDALRSRRVRTTPTSGARVNAAQCDPSNTGAPATTHDARLIRQCWLDQSAQSLRSSLETTHGLRVRGAPIDGRDRSHRCLSRAARPLLLVGAHSRDS